MPILGKIVKTVGRVLKGTNAATIQRAKKIETARDTKRAIKKLKNDKPLYQGKRKAAANILVNRAKKAGNKKAIAATAAAFATGVYTGKNTQNNATLSKPVKKKTAKTAPKKYKF